MGRPAPNAEPGTGEQIHVEATKPCQCFGELPKRSDDPSERTCPTPGLHDHDTTYRDVHGNVWECGRDYIDTDIMDVCELVEVIRRSAWCDTRDPENATVYLVFEAERAGHQGSRYQVQPNNRDDKSEQFKERYRESPPGPP